MGAARVQVAPFGKLYLLKRERYPATIHIFSKTGEELWSRTINLMERGELHAIQIPGFAGTEHVPVKVRIDYADGTSDDV